MKKLYPEDAWDKDAELDCLDDAESDMIVLDRDDDDGELSKYLETDSEWFDGEIDEEFLDDDSMTEEEAMDWARRYGGE